MKIENQILNLKPDLNALKANYIEQIKQLQEQIQALVEVSSDFDHSWVGSWASESYNYYSDIIENSGSTVILTSEIIQDFIENKAGIKIDKIEGEVLLVLKSYQEFQEKIITELSIIKSKENLEPEIEILDKIENHDWGMSPRDYIKMRRPNTVFTHNPGALLNKGLDTPPHYIVAGKLMALFSHLAAIENFQANAARLLRQLEIKFSIDDKGPEKSDFIITLINNFHTVASQLRNRYDNRESLIIKDEYDVQDLLNGLLRIEFDDVRPEEYTPSYAGSSARVDFLLKKEKIVIEVKKTRDGLKDKQVGDQLILDTQHYKAHPDCKHLICFVYDPESKIKNPRGLESDLSTLSTEDMLVDIYIRP